jgi:hypothetical protein
MEWHWHASAINSPLVKTDSTNQLFSISIDDLPPDNANQEANPVLVSKSSDKNQGVNTPKPSKESSDDLDFFDSNTLIPSNSLICPNQGGDLNTIDQQMVEEAHNSGPVHKIIDDICEQNIVEGRLRPRHEANLVLYIQNNPKTYSQAVHAPDQDHWKGAVDTKQGNMD